MIWIIGGTKDSRDILEKLLENKNEEILVTTATSYGGKLLEELSELAKTKYNREIKIISERLNEEQMEKLVYENNIDLVIDASHPYAQNVSKTIINVKNIINEKRKNNEDQGNWEKSQLRYVRFERKMLDYGDENVKKFETLEEMNNFIQEHENKNILSTLGSNNLAEIQKMGEKNNLYVRILPTTDSIVKAEELGYLPAKIIAIQGPVDKILNKAMLESYKIDFLITKESGATGGEKEKVDACRENGTTVLVLTRPFVDYGEVYYDINDLIKNL